MVVEKPQYLYKVCFSKEEIETLTKAAEIIDKFYDELTEFDFCIMPNYVAETTEINTTANNIKGLVNIIGVCTCEGYDKMNFEELWEKTF